MVAYVFVMGAGLLFGFSLIMSGIWVRRRDERTILLRKNKKDEYVIDFDGSLFDSTYVDFALLESYVLDLFKDNPKVRVWYNNKRGYSVAELSFFSLSKSEQAELRRLAGVIRQKSRLQLDIDAARSNAALLDQINSSKVPA